MAAVKVPSGVAPITAWLALDHVSSGFAILDETGRILYVNPANARLLGWDRDALIGQSIGVLLPAEMRDRVPDLLAELLRSGSLEEEFVNVATDGSPRPIHVGAHVVKVGRRGKRYIVTEIRELSGLLEQLERLSVTARSIAADPDWDVLSFIVRAARALTGARYAALGIFSRARELVRFIPDGMSGDEITRIDHWPEGRGLLRTIVEEARTVNVRDIGSDPRNVGFPAGHPAMVSFLGVPIRIGDRAYGQLYMTDKQGASAFSLADERLAELFASYAAVAIRETRQHQSQKMEAIGQLAGGMAHDFNNLLTAIRGYADLVWDGLPAGDEANRADVGEIIAAADRAAELTRQLLAFSRSQVLQPQIVDPAAVVEGIVPLLRRLIGEHIDIVTAAEPGAGQVRVDPSQLEQVIVNLAINARDAMPEGGRLTLEIAAAELEAEDAWSHPEVPAGRYVMLAASDTGIGMDPETRTHVFEPFFTTKAPGQGTGLGLATVYGIVTQSGGWIYVYSDPGRGTTFKIYLPRVAEEATAVERPTAAVAPPPTGSETVLLVEDEPAVRALAARLLVGLGYSVLQAASGAEALELAASHQGPIDLLVTDVVMPGLQGRELAARLTAVRPSTRVLYVSGFMDSQSGPTEISAGTAFLPKPFTVEALGEAVRQALNHRV